MAKPAKAESTATKDPAQIEAEVLAQMRQHQEARDAEAIRMDEYFYWFWEMGLYDPSDYEGHVQAWKQAEQEQFLEAEIGKKYTIGDDIPNDHPIGYPDGTHLVVPAGSVVELMGCKNHTYRLFRLVQPGAMPTNPPPTRKEELAGAVDQRPLARTRKPAESGYRFYLDLVGMRYFGLTEVPIR